MKIAQIIENNKDTGDHVIFLKKQEGQDILNILTEYCDQNKRKKIAKKYLKAFEDNCCCY